MSKVLTSSPRRGRAAAASQDRLNVPSFKSSHFPPKTILFSGHCRRKGWVVEKGAALWPFRDSSIVNSDFFAGFSLVIFSSPFFLFALQHWVCSYEQQPSPRPQTSQFDATIFLIQWYKQWKENPDRPQAEANAFTGNVKLHVKSLWWAYI